MRTLLLTGTAFLLMAAGPALAWGGHNTTVNVPIVKNSAAVGSGTNSSATSGGTAVSASLSHSANTSNSYNTPTTTTDSNNTPTTTTDSYNTPTTTTTTDSYNTPTTTTDSHNKSLSVLAVIGSNYATGNSTLSTVSNHINIDEKLATAVSKGDVNDNYATYQAFLAKVKVGQNADMSNAANGTGIVTAQQSTGDNSLQQDRGPGLADRRQRQHRPVIWCDQVTSDSAPCPHGAESHSILGRGTGNENKIRHGDYINYNRNNIACWRGLRGATRFSQ